MNRLLPALFLTLLPAVMAAAETPQDQMESLATALQKGDAHGALDLFDPHMPGFAEVKRDIEALSQLPNNYCTITIIHTTQAADSTVFETDWSLQLYSAQNSPQLDRRDRVEMSLRRIDNVWKIVALSPVSVLAPPDSAIFTRIALLASALNEKDESDALGVFDSRMKEYGEIDNDIDALITQNDVLCALDVVSDRQTGAIHTLDLDWYFQLKSRADGGPTQQRRERVQVTMEQVKGKWKISHLDSLKILSPIVE